MSLDISLTDNYCEHCKRSDEVYRANITHNLSDMAEALGIYEVVWCPDENAIVFAGQLVKPLEKALRKMRKYPERYKKYNSPNGWGTYQNFLTWLDELLYNCKRFRDARVVADR